MIKKKDINKKDINATKHVYDGIKFDSGLELFCYKELKRNDVKFVYHPYKVTFIEPFTLNFNCYERVGKIYRDEDKKIINNTRRFEVNNKVRGMGYTPDFADINGSWIIETKGRPNERFPLIWKLFKKKLNDEGFKGIILKPENQGQVLETIDIIKEFLKNKQNGEQ